MADAGTVVVGSGHAGFETAAALRRYGYEGRVLLLSEEASLPYQRPPLSKTFLSGKTSIDQLTFRPVEFYKRHAIELLLGERAVLVDRSARRVRCASGLDLEFSTLVLATGARARRIPLPGGELDGVVFLRTLDDARDLASRLADCERIAVIGGGFIGLELAAVASSLGVSVVVIEALPRLLARSVTDEVARFYAKVHRDWGSEVLLHANTARLTGVDARVRGIELRDGQNIRADLVVVAVGAEPDVALAESSGLPVANGIVVDEHLHTPDPRIFAIGDCACFPGRPGGQTVRLESVQNAADQAACVARQIAGVSEPYRTVPWFWSDQRDLKLQMAGMPGGHDLTVIRGQPSDQAFSVLRFSNRVLVGGESVNRPADHMVVRRLLDQSPERRAELTPERAADPAVDLKAAIQASTD